MVRRQLTIEETIKSLHESLNSEFEDERIVAQLILKEYNNERVAKHENHMQFKRMGDGIARTSL